MNLTQAAIAVTGLGAYAGAIVFGYLLTWGWVP